MGNKELKRLEIILEVKTNRIKQLNEEIQIRDIIIKNLLKTITPYMEKFVKVDQDYLYKIKEIFKD